MTRTKPCRWIAAEIRRLDPATDYEAIWRLTSSYDTLPTEASFAELHPER